MTLILELPDKLEASLKAKARAQGVSAEQYAAHLLQGDLEKHPQCNGEPFWKSFTSQVHALPAEVFERLPTDGASQHDHYLYGAAKK